MRKFGKYEMRLGQKAEPKNPVEKTNTKTIGTKNALLQTYFTSLLSLVLSVSLFLGTSYAWFTSEVNNPHNEIYVGMLKVGFFKETDEGPKDLAAGDATLFDDGICWEPGYTAVDTVEIVNKGDLAFKYVMSFTDGSLVDRDGTSLGSSALADVAEYFDVWVFNHLNKTYVDPTSYEVLTTTADWEYVGTLADVLDGTSVLSGDMLTVRKDGQDPAVINEGTTDGVATTDKYTIALHMKGNASAAVMGQKISLNVKLIAYQMASEQDKLGDATYDDNLVIADDAEELKTLLAAGSGNVIMASDIDLKNDDDCVIVKSDMLDGNGKTITYSGDKVDDRPVGVVTVSGGKIANLIVAGGDNGHALYVEKLTSDLVVTDSTFSGVSAFTLNSEDSAGDAIISFIDTTFNAQVSYANVAEHVYFTDCTFNGMLQPCGDTTLTNCTVALEALDVSKLEANEKITMINCTYNGKRIEKAVLTSGGAVIAISGSDLIEVNSEKMVALKGNG